MRRAIAIGTLTLGLCGPAAALISSEGHLYKLTCNGSGYVLTSDHPVGRFFGQGAATKISTGREAARTGWSGGSWCWANGGVFVRFDDYANGFPRQTLDCPATGPQVDLLDLSCGCN